MDRKHIDQEHLTVTGAHRSSNRPVHVEIHDDVEIVLTQAFGPRGDNLVGVSDVTFDGHPAVTLLVRANEKEGLVHLSPIHGDHRKMGFVDIPAGTRCALLCPISKEPLPYIGKVKEQSAAGYYALYLTKKLTQGSAVMVSDVWDDYHSRVVDNFELISTWANEVADDSGLGATT